MSLQVVHWVPIVQYINTTGYGNGVAMVIKQQFIIWTNDGLVYCDGLVQEKRNSSV